MTTIPIQSDIHDVITADAVVQEISLTTNVHQRALLRMLAVASQNELDPAVIVSNLIGEVNSTFQRKLEALARLIDDGVPVVEALAQVPDVIPEPAVMSLKTAVRQDLMDDVERRLINSPMVVEKHPAQSEDFNPIETLFGLAEKYLFTFAIITFLMLFIVPQFTDMFEEFRIELPWSMKFTVAWSSIATQFWFLLPLVAMLAIGYTVWRHPDIFRQYFARWFPGRWNAPVFARDIQQDLSLAWVVQAASETDQVALSFLKNRGARSDRSKCETAVTKIESGDGVWETLANEKIISTKESELIDAASSPASSAWLLRQVASKKSFDKHRRGFWFLKTFVAIANGILVLMTFSVCVAIFQCLLTIIRSA